jgi:hypothetical protein
VVKVRGDDLTPDLFAHERLFPVRRPKTLNGASDFNRVLAQAISRAMDEARARGIGRAEVAERMSAMLNASVSKGMLDAYSSGAREDHNISVVRFKALARATDSLWLWNVVLHDEGLTLLKGEEALLAQATYAQKQAQHWAGVARRLTKDAPIGAIAR